MTAAVSETNNHVSIYPGYTGNVRPLGDQAHTEKILLVFEEELASYDVEDVVAKLVEAARCSMVLLSQAIEFPASENTS